DFFPLAYQPAVSDIEPVISERVVCVLIVKVFLAHSPLVPCSYTQNTQRLHLHSRPSHPHPLTLELRAGEYASIESVDSWTSGGFYTQPEDIALITKFAKTKPLLLLFGAFSCSFALAAGAAAPRAQPLRGDPASAVFAVAQQAQAKGLSIDLSR